MGWRNRPDDEKGEEEGELGGGRRGSVMRQEGGSVKEVRVVVERPLLTWRRTAALGWPQEREGLGGDAVADVVVVVAAVAAAAALGVFARVGGAASAGEEEEEVVDDESEALLPGQGGRARLQKQSRRWHLAVTRA
jgi:hypothetical protein